MRRHPHDTYIFPKTKGRKKQAIRLLRDDILVRMDEESDMMAGGLLHKPQQAHEHVLAKGTVLAFGYITAMKKENTAKVVPIEPFPIPDIEVGDRCCFIKFRRYQDANKHLQQEYEEGVIAVKPEDILFVFTGDVELNQ